MGNGAPLVDVDNLSKKFCRDLRTSLYYGVQDLAKEFVGGGATTSELRSKEFWALRDVSLQVFRGDALGLIGANGAGKTSLLRILTGLIKPNAGAVTIRGRVGALIALGAGFNPILTGLENIYINAAILGIERKRVDALLDEIIDFADVRDFIHTPVQNYSSGMRVRLGFAVAANLTPDVLFVDEVLAVGDLRFREKSFARMQTMCDSGSAVVFVSHNMAAILTLCNRVAWLEKGRLRRLGPADEVVAEYLAEQERLIREDEQKASRGRGAGDSDLLTNAMWFDKVEIVDDDGNARNIFSHGEALTVRIHYGASQPVPKPRFVVQIGTQTERLFVADMLLDKEAPKLLEGNGVLECRFDKLPLLPRRYWLYCFVLGPTPFIKLVYPGAQLPFAICSDARKEAPPSEVMQHVRNPGVIRVPYRWAY